jgi:hypothetical protein
MDESWLCAARTGVWRLRLKSTMNGRHNGFGRRPRTGHSHLSAESLLGSTNRSGWLNIDGRLDILFGLRCITGAPSWIDLPKVPPCTEWCPAQPLNLGLWYVSLALEVWQGKGQPEQCGGIWLHAHENKGVRLWEIINGCNNAKSTSQRSWWGQWWKSLRTLRLKVKLKGVLGCREILNFNQNRFPSMGG